MKAPGSAIARACALMILLLPTPLFAQASAAVGTEQRVPFGDTQIVLHAPSMHCMLDPNQRVDQSLATYVFQPRAGKLNTYLGAFVDCQSLAAVRSAAPEQLSMASYAYYLAVTSTATSPVTLPREELLRRVCDNARARSGTLELAEQNAARDINARMDTLPTGKPWFGPIVAQDGNGCYQLVLYKSLSSGIENREAMLTIVTLINRRQVTYTRAVTYSNDALSSFVRMVQSEVADFVRLNP